MEEYNHLARNLRSYKATRNLTMKELSGKLNIPEATLRNVMKEGNTTLDTAIRISRSLDIGLDILVGDNSFSDKLFILDHMQKASSWLAELPNSKRDKISVLLAEIWEVMSE